MSPRIRIGPEAVLTDHAPPPSAAAATARRKPDQVPITEQNFSPNYLDLLLVSLFPTPSSCPDADRPANSFAVARSADFGSHEGLQYLLNAHRSFPLSCSRLIALRSR